MSHDLAILLPPVPLTENEFLDHLNNVYDRMEDAPGGAKIQPFIDLVSKLTAKFPDLGDWPSESKDVCPWADGPLIGNVQPELFYFCLNASRASEVLPFVLQEAMALGLVVFDVQTNALHHP